MNFLNKCIHKLPQCDCMGSDHILLKDDIPSIIADLPYTVLTYAAIDLQQETFCVGVPSFRVRI